MISFLFDPQVPTDKERRDLALFLDEHRRQQQILIDHLREENASLRSKVKRPKPELTPEEKYRAEFAL